MVRDSIMARPMIMVVRILPPASGLREVPSHAPPMAVPIPIPLPMAPSPIARPAARTVNCSYSAALPSAAKATLESRVIPSIIRATVITLFIE